MVSVRSERDQMNEDIWLRWIVECNYALMKMFALSLFFAKVVQVKMKSASHVDRLSWLFDIWNELCLYSFQVHLLCESIDLCLQ